MVLLLHRAILFVPGAEVTAEPTVGNPFTNPFTRAYDDSLLCVKDMGCLGSKDRLSKEDMDFLKSHTRYDESTIKEWYKGFKQDCPNGKLTPAKFVDMYKMFFPSGNAEEFCDHVFRTFDMDKNGYIDFKERLTLAPALAIGDTTAEGGCNNMAITQPIAEVTTLLKVA
ncbi:hypothetical protein ZHAS_00007740 [Anopheles sinensis]|uniref:EF-hand domain-containing protein n=1 Tax=Anopheles sinensis TaxID=74873 RepID=A0A084VQW4_ANOSI|nr:hypothetical protein ZHAS_00007740 [Anopheles sinensis]